MSELDPSRRRLRRPVRAALAACLAIALSACAGEPAIIEPAAALGPPIDIAPPPAPEQVEVAPPPPDLVVIGAVAFAPAPEEFDQENPITPTLGERLAESFGASRSSRVQATGDAWGMAILCRMPETVARLEAQGAEDLVQPDLVLLTRPPTDGERALCADQGVALEVAPIGRYLGGLPNDAGVEGAWIAYSAARIADFPEKQALIDRARLLIGADDYSPHFSAL